MLLLNLLIFLAGPSKKISKDSGILCTTHTNQYADCDGYHFTCLGNN